MKKAISLLVFVIFTFTTSLIYAEDYNLSQQQKEKIDKIVLKVETIINKQPTKEKKEVLKEKILGQLNNITLKIMEKGDLDMLNIIFYLKDKIEAIGGASRYPGCSADDINIEGLLFSACNLGASTPNELGVKLYWNKYFSYPGINYGSFIVDYDNIKVNGGATTRGSVMMKCAEGYIPTSVIYNMGNFASFLQSKNKNLLEELKIPNIDSYKLGITEDEYSNLSTEERIKFDERNKETNRLFIGDFSKDAEDSLFYEGAGFFGFSDEGITYGRCVKGDSKSIEDKIWKIIGEK